MFTRGEEMVGTKFTRLVEKHSEELSRQLAQKLHESPRTEGFRRIPLAVLEHDIHVLYRNLGEWLLHRTERELEARYSDIGRLRAAQQISPEELMWGFTIAKEHIISFLHREAASDDALSLFCELEFVMTLTQFFDRAVYFALKAQTMMAETTAVA